MASSAATSATSALASPTLAEGKATQSRQTAQHSVGVASMPSLPSRNISSPWKPSFYFRRPAKDVSAMAAGDVAAAELANELPEIVKKIQDAWDKVEDKYAVSSVAFAGFVALWSAGGVISAIDKLPVVPGVLEIVGIGFSGWFAYRNLVYKPDRDALVAKLKCIYADIIGSS